MIDIREDLLKTVKDILAAYIPECEVRVFGSRVNWTAKSTSDLDLVVVSKEKINWKKMAGLKAAFEESKIPFRVDVLDWNAIPENFKENIGKKFEVVQGGWGTKVVEDTDVPMDDARKDIWSEVSLHEISTEISYGYTASAIAEKTGPRFLRITDIQNGIVHWDTVPYCKIDTSIQKKYQLERGDIVVARTGNSTGENYIYNSDNSAVFASYLIRLKINTKIADPFFVWYNLRSPKWWEFINSSKTGSAQPGANAQVLARFRLMLPALPTQRVIAHILGTLDDKIELNRKINKTLEEIARAIYKSWFVDFDPVKKKAAGMPTGLPVEIEKLFPGEFEKSELGDSSTGLSTRIPKGWKVYNLPEVIEVNPTRQLTKGVTAPYLDMANMPLKGHLAHEVILREYTSGIKFKNGDTLLARITPCLENGKTAYVDFLKENEIGWGSTEFIVFCPTIPISSYFGYLLARDDRLRSFAITNMVGSSGRQRVPTDCFQKFKLPLPSDSDNLRSIMSIFNQSIMEISNKIRNNGNQMLSLSNLRDTLLPRLLSGSLPIRDAEKLLKEANI
jgi:type I restriction enzyme, S subunit